MTETLSLTLALVIGISLGAMFFPPEVMIRSFFRSVIVR